jgi:hypothetical protein
MTQPPPITLEAIGLNTYRELYALDTAEALRRIDDKRVPLHPGDAFLAVLVLRGVAELRHSAEHLDAAGRRFEIAGIVLAAVAVAVAIGELVRAFA